MRLNREGGGSLALGDKEEAYLRPSRSVTRYKQTRHNTNADRHVRIVTSKMSCAQEKERVVRETLPEANKREKGDGS